MVLLSNARHAGNRRAVLSSASGFQHQQRLNVGIRMSPSGGVRGSVGVAATADAALGAVSSVFVPSVFQSVALAVAADHWVSPLIRRAMPWW